MDARTWTLRVASCTGKAAFSSPALASKVVKRRTRKNRDRRNQHIYRCQYCGLFHIGTKPKSLHAPAQREPQGDDADMA